MTKKHIIGNLAAVYGDCIRQREVTAAEGGPENWTNDPDVWDDMAVLLLEAINYLIDGAK